MRKTLRIAVGLTVAGVCAASAASASATSYGSPIQLPTPTKPEVLSIAANPLGTVTFSDGRRSYEITAAGHDKRIGEWHKTVFGTAIDDTGDVYISGSVPHGVEEYLADGEKARIHFPGFKQPYSVAVDQAGDVFAAALTKRGRDDFHAIVEERHAGTGLITEVHLTPEFSLLYQLNLAVDAAGDAFITSGPEVLEIPAGSDQSALLSYSDFAEANADGIAVNSTGTELYVNFVGSAEQPAPSVLESVDLTTGETQTLPYAGLVDALAVDGAGNVYYATGNAAYELPVDSNASSLTTLP